MFLFLERKGICYTEERGDLMKRVKLYIAMSLDGYISTPDGSIDFLNKVEGEGDNGYLAFYSTIGTVVMGSLTYDWILRHARVFPYAQRRCYVMTSKERMNNANVTFTQQSPAELVTQIQQDSERDIWLAGGAKLVESFLQADLVDEMILTIAPVVLGEGIPLFSERVPMSDWKLIQTQNYNQFVELTYKKEE